MALGSSFLSRCGCYFWRRRFLCYAAPANDNSVVKKYVSSYKEMCMLEIDFALSAKLLHAECYIVKGAALAHLSCTVQVLILEKIF